MKFWSKIFYFSSLYSIKTALSERYGGLLSVWRGTADSPLIIIVDSFGEWSN